MGRMKRWNLRPLSLFGLGLALSLLMGGCALYPRDQSQEVQVDSVTLNPRLTYGVTSTPFCLHLSFRNRFQYVYSEHKVDAWTTDGSCAAAGARRVVDTLALSWRDETYTQQDKQCMAGDHCTMAEQRVVEGRTLRCASARARTGDQSAFISTDQAACR